MNVDMTDTEAKMLITVLASAYRAAHRESWEVERMGDPRFLPECRERLAALAALLERLGSSAEEAMAPILGTRSVEEP